MKLMGKKFTFYETDKFNSKKYALVKIKLDRVDFQYKRKDKTKEDIYLGTDIHGQNVPGPSRPHDVGRQVVDVPAVEKEVAIVRVTQGREVSRERHGTSNVTPQTPVVMDPLRHRRDVGCQGEVRQPRVLKKKLSLINDCFNMYLFLSRFCFLVKTQINGLFSLLQDKMIEELGLTRMSKSLRNLSMTALKA